MRKTIDRPEVAKAYNLLLSGDVAGARNHLRLILTGKRCSTCMKWKEHSEFYGDGKNYDRGECRHCHINKVLARRLRGEI